MPPRVTRVKRPSTTYKKVVTKRSGKVKEKAISEKKYKRKLKRAVKSEARGKRKSVSNNKKTTLNTYSGTANTTRKQTISKKNDKGRKKTFVATNTRRATDKEKARLVGKIRNAAAVAAAKKKREQMKIKKRGNRRIKR